MSRVTTRSSKSVVVGASLVLLLVSTACPLPSNVRFRCESDGTCVVPGQVCGADLFCHLPGEAPNGDAGPIESDGGIDAGPCVRHDVTTECAAAECGFVNDGCEDVDCNHACPGPQECGVFEPNRCGLPHLCTPSGWCWENPLPQGQTILGAVRLDARHAWFVGEGALVLFHDGEKSSLQDPKLPAVDLFAVGGANTSDLYVVGAQGAISHFDGTTWEREGANPQPTTALKVVYGFADGGALAGGPGGLLLSRRALLPATVRWTPELLPVTDEVRGIFEDPQGRVRIITRRAQLFVRNAAGVWEFDRAVDQPFTEPFAVILWRDGVLVGGNGNNQATLAWQPLDAQPDAGWTYLSPAVNGVQSLVAVADGGVVAVGPGGLFTLVQDLSDAGMVRLNVSAAAAPGAVAAVSNGGHRVLTGGQNGAMAQVDLDLPAATALAPRSTPLVRRGHNLNAVCGTSPSQLFALGSIDGSAPPDTVRWFERTEGPLGVEWKAKGLALGSTTRLMGCFAEPNRAWFTGDDSKFIEWVAGTPVYSDFTGAFGGQYVGAWGTSGSYYFVRNSSPDVTVSDSGVSGSFRAEPTNSPTDLAGVWGTSSTDVVVVGGAGSLSRYDGAAWTNSTVGTEDFNAVHGALLGGTTPFFVAVGNNGAAATVTGTGSALELVDPLLSLESVWVAPDGVAWAGGTGPDAGVLYRRDNAGDWVNVPLPTTRPVTGVFGLSDGGTSTVWVVGPRGLILRR
ncbi:MAG: hypothetical protein U0228_08170 [Myxococcaceae bacterium]